MIERLPAERVEAQVQLEEDVLLALEVVVERGLGDAESLGDLAQRGLVVALLVEQLERDVEDALAHRPAGPSACGALPRWAAWRSPFAPRRSSVRAMIVVYLTAG